MLSKSQVAELPEWTFLAYKTLKILAFYYIKLAIFQSQNLLTLKLAMSFNANFSYGITKSTILDFVNSKKFFVKQSTNIMKCRRFEVETFLTVYKVKCNDLDDTIGVPARP